MDVQDRVVKVIGGEMPDRVPIFIPGFEPRFLETFDAAHDDAAGSKICICNGKDLTPLVHLGVDLCEVPGPPHLKPEQELPRLDDEFMAVDMFGRVFKRHVSGNVEYLDYQGPYLRTEDAIKQWNHLIPQQIDPDWYDRVYKETLACVDTHAICPLFKACDGIYSILEQAIGIENMAFMLHDKPEMIDFLLDKIYKIVINDVKGLLDAKVAFILICDDITIENHPSITPDLVEKHLLPLYTKLVDRVHTSGGKAFFRTTGDVLNVIGTLVKAGFDAVHVTNPEPSYLEEAKMFWGDRICIIGNLDVMSVLSLSTPIQVKRKVKELLDIAKGSGRYIFGTNDVLINSAKLGNVEAMIAAAKQHGMY
nr:uroporphyrinogen decarboxylase family protein [Candidatus Sigynarchaeota archaeon]